MALPLIVIALCLGALGIAVLTRILPGHWRGALLAGTLALFFWGSAVAVANFIEFSGLINTDGIGDPRISAELLASSLVRAFVACLAVLHLLALNAAVFATAARPRTPERKPLP